MSYVLSCSSTVDLTPAQMKARDIHFICFHIRIIISQFNDITAIHDSDVNMHVSDGFCLFSAGFTNREHALGWILSFRGGAELLEPPELREELERIGKMICQKHHT